MNPLALSWAVADGGCAIGGFRDGIRNDDSPNRYPPLGVQADDIRAQRSFCSWCGSPGAVAAHPLGGGHGAVAEAWSCPVTLDGFVTLPVRCFFSAAAALASRMRRRSS